MPFPTEKREKDLAGRCKNKIRFFRKNLHGMSLTEVLVVISFLAIVAAISIPSITGLVTGSSYETARRNLNYLNGAVIAFNQANRELSNSAGSGVEQTIFSYLRYRDSVNPAPGSPYLPPTATCVASSDTNIYRAQWNGKMFKMLAPGTTGSGLDLLKVMGSTISTNSTSNPFQ